MLDALPSRPLEDDEITTSLRTYLLSVAEHHLHPGPGPASDFVQEALLKAHGRQDQFRGSTAEELRAWLRAILLNLIHDHRRAAGRREVPLEAGSPYAREDSPSHYARQAEANDRLARALEQLSPEHREVVALRFDADLTFAQIGARTGRSEDAARMLLDRAVALLRGLLVEA